MRSILIAAFAVLALIAGAVAWLELSGPPESSMTLPGGGQTAELPTGEDDRPPEPEPADRAKRGVAANLPEAKPGPLPAAPKDELLEPGVEGRIARIGPDGMAPWQAYAKPFANPEDKPVVAVLVTNLGLTDDTTRLAIEKLPGAVSLVFSPYAGNLERWSAAAREAGHETLVALPMEPLAYPANDPGDQALLVDLPASENSLRQRWALSRFAGYVGAAGFMGGRFIASAGAVRPMMRELAARGLMYLDTSGTPESVAEGLASEMGVPFAEAHLVVDVTLSAGAIDSRLDEAAALARREGRAVALAEPYPLSVERIALWAAELDDVALAPVTALAEPPATR